MYWRIFVSRFYLEYLLAKLLALKKLDFVRNTWCITSFNNDVYGRRISF